MNGLGFLDLVIGLIFIYLVYSIACSTLWEIIINILHLRGKMLYNWVIENFNQNSSTLGDKIISHPLVKVMSLKSNKMPAYISSGVFAEVLLDAINSENNNDNAKSAAFSDDDLKRSIESSKLLDSGLKRIFLQYIYESKGNLAFVREKIANWYDEAQEILLGNYKKNLQRWIFLISVILVGSTNADTIRLASYLYGNDEARGLIANKASLFVQDTNVIRLITKIDTASIDAASKRNQAELADQINKNIQVLKDLNSELRQSSIPIGWSEENIEDFKLWDYIRKIVGLLLTALAVSVGSPFWFDILSKLSNLRSVGLKPKSSLDDQETKQNSGKVVVAKP